MVPIVVGYGFVALTKWVQQEKLGRLAKIGMQQGFAEWQGFAKQACLQKTGMLLNRKDNLWHADHSSTQHATAACMILSR